MHVAMAKFPIDDVVEARVMIERWNVELAAANASSDELAELGGLLDSMEDPQLPLDEFNQLDTTYHVGIAELGGNQLVIVLTTAVRRALAVPIRRRA